MNSKCRHTARNCRCKHGALEANADLLVSIAGSDSAGCRAHMTSAVTVISGELVHSSRETLARIDWLFGAALG